ncbi:OR5A2 protein, partial [Cochlearius cochlearius]|nr:OR5A2 protein [Cochlearius cochlearius]
YAQYAVQLFLFTFLIVAEYYLLTVKAYDHSQQGRHKTFSTCLPHLAAVSLFVNTGIFSNMKPPFMKPPSMSSPSLDLVVAVLYAVFPPAVNPLIYSMRNKELINSMRKLMTGFS